MPLYWKTKIVLIKLETSYAVDPTPAAGNGILMTGVEFSPLEGQDVSRDLERPFRGAQELIPVGLHCRLRGRIELVPSGTAGVAPGWGPVMRLLGVGQTIVADTSVAYAPVAPTHESGHLYFWIGGTLHKVSGIRGDGTMRLNAQGLPYLEVELTGLYAGVSETARTNPTLTGFKRPRVVTNANTPDFSINSVSMVMRSFALALRNQVVPRLLVNSEEVLIVDSDDTISCQVQAVPVSTLNPYALAQADEAASLIPVEIEHGTQAGYILNLSAPTCQMQRPAGFANQDNILEWPLSLKALPSAAGHDQWTLTLT
jgi:hypothetical protein